MVVHAQFSCDETSIERKKLWDPVKTLEINNMDPGYQCITCAGYAPSQRRRCRNPIRAENREFIMKTMNDIAYLRPDSSAVMSRLRSIVGPALCVRFHKNQAESILSKWQTNIQKMKPQVKEKVPADSIRSSKKQGSTRDTRVTDIFEQLREMKEALAKLQEEADSQRQQDEGYESREEQDAKDREEEERTRRRKEERDRKARRQEKERLEKERLEKKRLEKERLEKERLEKERLEKERLEKERLEKERLEKERLEKERREKERLEKERKESEEKKQQKREQAASNERMRQRAQKVREEREREKREKEETEREEWDQLWTDYQERWAQFRKSPSTERTVSDAIPWPVKSGLYRDVKASTVQEFLQKAVPRGANMSNLMRKECHKWHPDRIYRTLQGFQHSDADPIVLEMICRVVTDLLNDSAGRSAEFLD